MKLQTKIPATAGVVLYCCPWQGLQWQLAVANDHVLLSGGGDKGAHVRFYKTGSVALQL